MPLFKCELEAENLPGHEDDEGLLGFVTTRWAEADTPELASALVIDALINEPKFRSYAGADWALADVRVVEVWLSDERPAVDPGYAFYPMGS